MKRMISLLLAVLLCLGGCSRTDAAITEPADTTAEQAVLAELLTEIDNTVFPGTAGSSLNAACMAAKLLDWSRSTALDEDTISAVTKTAMETARKDDPVSFAEKMQSVYTAYEQLLSPNGEALLSSCGYTGDGYPWSEEDAAALKCVMETVSSN